MNQILRAMAVSTVAMTCFAAGASAQTLSSIDFNAVGGTSWSNAMTAPVRLDFGAGMGLGTVSFTAVNGGSFQNVLTPFAYNSPPFSAYNGPTLLSNGALFAPSFESVFTVNPSAAPGLSGFTMTVTLDSGSFAPGSVFSPRSLGRNGSNFQYFSPVAGLGAPDSVQLPTDGTGAPDMVLLDSVNNLYGAAGNTGASSGLAFAITGGNTFTASFLNTPGFQPGGVAMTIAVSAVPEPSTWALLLAGVGSLAFVSRRRAVRSN